jgi:hypothetical protein
MSNTPHKVAAVLTMFVAALILAVVFANAAPHFSGVARDTALAAAPSVADIDW